MVKQRLNGLRGQRLFTAIADAVGVQRIVERQLVGDALRVDFEVARGDRLDLRPPEARRATAIFDHRRTAAVAYGLPVAALAVAVLVPGQHLDVGKAGARRAMRAWQAL